jgi:uncharacterized membrane protein HdeD (DUF308 family)
LANSVDQVVRSLRTMTITLGVFGVVTGLILLLWPSATLTVLAVVLGVHFLVGGVVTIVSAVGGPDHERVLSLFAGLISLIAGVVVIYRPLQTIVFLLVVAAVFWVIRGVTDIVDGLFDSEEGSRPLMIISGLVSLGAGIIVLVWPDATLNVLVRIAGVWMVLLGLLRIAVGRSIPKV